MEMKLQKRLLRILYIASFFGLAIYSLRHVGLGVDLWDGGYNYANSRYHDLEHMDSMWYFATWLAGAAGHFLTKLPGGGTMLGMNVYTSLLAGAMAMASYGFCVKKLRFPPWLVFGAELTALSLCWAPSGALYNYLTYVFLLAGTLFLYQGLAAEKKWCLFLAGACLGLNMGVRFSNLVQTGLILAVWYDAFLSKKKFGRVLRETGICILGYAAGSGLFLLCMAVGPGWKEYWAGIARLFGMTEHADDYTATSMLTNMAGAYYEATYWLKRFGLAAVCAAVCCGLFPKRWEKAKKLSTAVIFGALLIWLYKKNYCYGDYRVYDSIYHPCLVVFEFAILFCILLMAAGRVARERKLLALLTILTILLTSLGGNNAVYSSINNLFLALPCFLGMAHEFFKERRQILYLPVKSAMVMSVLLLFWQSLQFGAYFVYEEATGARDLGREVQGIPVLQGMRTGEEKAEALEGLYGYLRERGPEERECILYGNIPGTAYYMELAPAMNVWSDLRSYGLEVMEEELALLERELREGGERPLVILESRYADYLAAGEDTGLFAEAFTREKLLLLHNFMVRNGYMGTYRNDLFVVYEQRFRERGAAQPENRPKTLKNCEKKGKYLRKNIANKLFL